MTRSASRVLLTAALILASGAPPAAGIPRPDVLGVTGGFYGGKGSEALSGSAYRYPDAKFGSALTAGARALWRFEDEDFDIDYGWIELRWSTYATTLREYGLEYGTLRVFPLGFNMRLGSGFRPPRGAPGALYATFGLGTLLPLFEKGPVLEAFEEAGVPTDVGNDIGVTLTVGAGVEIFVAESYSVEADLEYMLAGCNTDWEIAGTTVGDFEFLHPGGLMLSFGVNVRLAPPPPVPAGPGPRLRG